MATKLQTQNIRRTQWEISPLDLKIRFDQVKRHACWRHSIDLITNDLGEVLIVDEDAQMPVYSDQWRTRMEMLNFLNGYSHCLNELGV